ncbi:MAG: hypothetical protein P8J25_07450 [Porticoccaceae bacterium]|nr:hypothetical protein [Porticoccaceae bacterium]
MYSAESYTWGWIAYSAGALCLLGLFWLLIRKIASRWIQHILMIILLAVFFTPVTAYPDNPYLAPAFFVSLYEGILLSDRGMGFQRGLAPILAVSFISIILYSLISPILGRRKKSRSH